MTTTENAFPQAFQTACRQAAQADPSWHHAFETSDLLACTPAQLHELAEKAPNPYLAGILAGQALERAIRG